MIAAAKEEMAFPFPWCADPALAADLFPEQPRLMVRTFNPQKPHQGVTSKNPALHQGQPVCNSTIALGMRGLAALNRVGSRCTGKERDAESGLDNFVARYMSSSMGRFMTPDWAAKPTAVPYAMYGDPQSLNLYTYEHNNPVAKADPDGHCGEDACVVEGVVGGVTILVMATQAYYAMPPEQRNFGASLTTAAATVGSTIKSWFHSSDNSKTAPESNPAPGTQTGTQAGNPHAPGDVPDGQVVVRGGKGAIPSSGTYSGAQGATVEEAGKGVPHGTVSATTGGEIRAAGGEVRPAPEPAYPGGPINGQHVNVTGGQSAFGPQQANPVPPSQRVPSTPKPPKLPNTPGGSM